jgi:hypothetical protein
MDLWWSWVFILSAVAAGMWTVVPWLAIEVPLPALATADVWDGVWPIAMGAVLLLTAWLIQRRWPIRLHLPPADVLWLFSALLSRCNSAWAGRHEKDRQVLDLYGPVLTLLEEWIGRKQATYLEATLNKKAVTVAVYLFLMSALVPAVLAG